MTATQTHREISVSCELAADTLLFRAMEGSEQLGRLSEYRVQLSSARMDIRIGEVLGKPMGVHVALGDGNFRHFHGLVTRFRYSGRDDEGGLYEAVLHPWPWLLTRSADCRIFQNMSIPDIVDKVCRAPQYGGVADLKLNALAETHEALPYCVQYRETDFNFICRLLEQAGIYFYFTHEEDRHTMVLADSCSAHDAIKGGPLKFSEGERPLSSEEETVFAWSTSGEIQSSSCELKDFDFEQTGSCLSDGLLARSNIPAAFDVPKYAVFDYPGLYNTAGAGTARARQRMEALHSQCERIEAASNSLALYVGGLFVLSEHPRDDQNRSYLVTEASYTLKGNAYRSGGTADDDFHVALAAVDDGQPYRPLEVTRKPVVQGPQTAIVVGPAGEEIHTDKYGRVKVQFHWDRLGKDDEKSSCWVRVAQGWAGKGWGAMFIPRVGMEVVVEFLEGDPDRPLVTGCVYNSDAMPPYPLPARSTVSTLMSNSSQGGEGYNELRFEDKKGEEEVYVQAERDFVRVVKNNDTLKVGFETADKGDQDIAIKNDRRLDVGHDQQIKIGNTETIEIGKDQQLKIANDQGVEVDNNQSIKVGKDQSIKVGKDQSIEVGKDQSMAIDGHQKVKAAQTIVIEAGTSIELKVGASSIKIEAAKITIKSMEISIASDARTDLKAGAMMTLEGGLVKIN